MELIRGVLAGELSLALVTAPQDDGQITAVPLARARLYAALPEHHPAVKKDRLLLHDLQRDQWILFARQVHPMIHDAILETARLEGIAPKDNMKRLPRTRRYTWSQNMRASAIFAEPPSIDYRLRGVAIRPLGDKSLYFDTCLIMTADQGSRVCERVRTRILEEIRSSALAAATNGFAPARVKLAPWRHELWCRGPRLG